MDWLRGKHPASQLLLLLCFSWTPGLPEELSPQPQLKYLERTECAQASAAAFDETLRGVSGGSTIHISFSPAMVSFLPLMQSLSFGALFGVLWHLITVSIALRTICLS